MSGEGNLPFNLGVAVTIKETDRALLVQIADEDEPRWIPKSVIHDDSEVYKFEDMESEQGELIVQAWWAEKEGLT